MVCSAQEDTAPAVWNGRRQPGVSARNSGSRSTTRTLRVSATVCYTTNLPNRKRKRRKNGVLIMEIALLFKRIYLGAGQKMRAVKCYEKCMPWSWHMAALRTAVFSLMHFITIAFQPEPHTMWHFHHTVLLEYEKYCSGDSLFLCISQSSAISGYSVTRLWSGDAAFPAQTGHLIPITVRLQIGACREWPLAPFRCTFKLNCGKRFMGSSPLFLSGATPV